MSNSKKKVELAKDKKFNLTQFEVLETSGDVMKGGFTVALSSALGGTADKKDDTVVNNCLAGNCVAGCGVAAPAPSSK